MKRKYIIIGILATALLLIIGLPALFTWSMDRHGGNLELFKKVTTGMTPQEVESILGKPWKKRSVDTNAIIWTYGSSFKWCALNVRFDQNNNVETKWHDH